MRATFVNPVVGWMLVDGQSGIKLQAAALRWGVWCGNANREASASK